MRFPALFLLACAGAAGAATPTPENTAATVRRDALLLGADPAVFVCAADLSAPKKPAGSAEETAAAARDLAERLARCGFTMAELPAGPADFADAFVGACRERGLRVRAEALAAVRAEFPSPADAALLDEPDTADDWTNALAQARASGFDPFLAAPWDPRLEMLLETRLRTWARAFNPASGRKRADDGDYALFSFTSSWQTEMKKMLAPGGGSAMPDFFAEELRLEWNDWLFEKYGSDKALARAVGPLPEGESLLSSSVSFFSPAGAEPSTAFASVRILFLAELDLRHLRRLLEGFRLSGSVTAVAPVVASNNGGRTNLSVSDLRGRRDKRTRGPLVWRAAAAEVLDDPVAAALAARDAGASVFEIPVGRLPPERFSFAAQAFRALAADPAAAPGADGSVDTDRFSFLRGPLPEPGIMERRSFRSGLVLRVVRTAPGAGSAADAATPSTAPLAATVWTPAPEEGVPAKKPGAAPVLCVAFFRPDGAVPPRLSVSLREKNSSAPFGLLLAGELPAKRGREARNRFGRVLDGLFREVKGGFAADPESGSLFSVDFPPASLSQEILKQLQ